MINLIITVINLITIAIKYIVDRESAADATLPMRTYPQDLLFLGGVGPKRFEPYRYVWYISFTQIPDLASLVAGQNKSPGA